MSSPGASASDGIIDVGYLAMEFPMALRAKEADGVCVSIDGGGIIIFSVLGLTDAIVFIMSICVFIPVPV